MTLENVERLGPLRSELAQVLKSLLYIWSKQNQALSQISFSTNDCDKTVVVQRNSGEFGFRIHGSKPVVISAIEPGTPAESSGLEVGDIVLSVNGISVLEKSHSEVVKIAHAGSDTLTLDVARTCDAVTPRETGFCHSIVYSGYLWKLGGYASGKNSGKWVRRWFVLKENNCLYCYKNDTDKQPVGVLMLLGHKIEKVNDDKEGFLKPHRFEIKKEDSISFHLSADNPSLETKWIEVLTRSTNNDSILDKFLEQHDLSISPSCIQKPDCFGYLIKLGNQWQPWSRRYCVLKDACMYFFQDINSKTAFGLAYLHGYKVQQSASSNKKHSFELMPSDNNQKSYQFLAESEADRKRWIAALEYSIDKWFKIQ